MITLIDKLTYFYIFQVNVIGKQCDRCRNGTFSLQTDNPKGCTECYCFHRSMECVQAPYSWTMVLIMLNNESLILDIIILYGQR